MGNKKLFTGISLEGDTLKFSVIRINNKKVQLLRVDKLKLSEKIYTTVTEDFSGDDDTFGIDSMSNPVTEESEGNLNDNILEEISDELNFELDGIKFQDELIDTDSVSDINKTISNEIQLSNFFSLINSKKVNLGLNIPTGTTFIQVLDENDFSKMKKKDLNVIIDDRLESFHGESKIEDYFSYTIRDDGALLLSSIEGEPKLLSLIDRTQSIYKGQIFVEDILPDEIILHGLVKANYVLEEKKITCVVQFSETNCRVFFLQGEHILLVSPIITEGVRSRKFLTTVFSKILFQLDTGEIPNLDKIIICNNSLGKEGIIFFKDRFPDIEVSEFKFSEDLVEPLSDTSISLSEYTTSIGIAWAASKFKNETFNNISFLPKHVTERQKKFKLQWHGIFLLLLIFFSLPLINSVWQKSFLQINIANNEISMLDNELQVYSNTVNNFNRVKSLLSQIQDQLILMNTLSKNSITWSVNLNLINKGIGNIGDVWLQSITPGDTPNSLSIQGVARNRESVSKVAELFAEATLLDATRSSIRDVEVYNFSYYVTKIVSNTEIYTPENLQKLDDLTGE